MKRSTAWLILWILSSIGIFTIVVNPLWGSFCVVTMFIGFCGYIIRATDELKQMTRAIYK